MKANKNTKDYFIVKQYANECFGLTLTQLFETSDKLGVSFETIKQQAREYNRSFIPNGDLRKIQRIACDKLGRKRVAKRITDWEKVEH